eukprot:CAMPEP_0172732820 /NCGR_PEP_ID=MMETSP1074-20121228/105417_1 /TAXON_ID=2916 /ORGANISM="Ceratium fusus, Strain PA161109" /LENGTH=65 /DNA_ID=CAMNT_0013561201 /DNA_START=83 /DNA_END=277 /DNA_ORIENTATION=-
MWTYTIVNINHHHNEDLHIALTQARRCAKAVAHLHHFKLLPWNCVDSLSPPQDLIKASMQHVTTW